MRNETGTGDENVEYALRLHILITNYELQCTILNNPYKDVTVYTTDPSKIVYGQDTFQTNKNSTHLMVRRGKEALWIIAITDSLTKYGSTTISDEHFRH